MVCSLCDQGLFDDLAVDHEAGEVRQALGDAVLLAGAAANRPAHPALSGLLNRIAQGGAGKETVLHIVGKVTAVAAVEEGADRLERLAGGIRDRGHRDRPGGLGVVVHRAPKAPGLYAEHRIKAFMWSELLCGVQCRGTADGLCQG